MSGTYRSFAYRVDIAVPVERVWRAFTDSAMLRRWCADEASITPREKGRLQVTFSGTFEFDAHIDVLVTAQRLRLIIMPTPGMPPTESVIVEDFLFERGAKTTTLRLLSSGVPQLQTWVTYYLSRRRCWELALTRLKVFLEKDLDQKSPDKTRY